MNNIEYPVTAPPSSASPVSAHLLKITMVLLLIISMFFCLPVTNAVEHTQGQQESLINLSPEQLTQRLQNARQSLTNLPDETSASAQENQLRTTLQRHINLLEEYLSQQADMDKLQQQNQDNSGEIDRTREQLQTLTRQATESNSETIVQQQPLTGDLPTIEARLNAARINKNVLLEQQTQQQQLEQAMAGYLSAAASRYQQAEQRETMLLKSRATEQTQAAITLADKQIENAQLDKMIARQTEALLRARQQWYRNNEPLLQLKLELADMNILHLEEQLARYQQALQTQLAEQTRLAEQALEEKERSAKQAVAPNERFLANWEAAIARSQKNISEYQALTATLSKDVTEQEKWANLEEEEFTTLRNLIAGQESYNASGRIKRSLIRIRQQSELLQNSLDNEKFRQLDTLRERSFAITDTLFGLSDTFDTERQAVMAELNQDQAANFRVSSQRLLLNYRNMLREEKSILTELLSQGQKLQLTTQQRLDKLTDFERMIRSTSFWIRDVAPLNWKTLRALPGDLLHNLNLLQQWLTRAAVEHSSDTLQSLNTLTYLLLLFLLMPAGLIYLRRRLRRLSTRINDKVKNEGKSLQMVIAVLFTGLLSAALIPAYLFVVARLAQASPQSLPLAGIISLSFDHLALFLLLWFSSRSFFAGRSISEIQFGLPRESANSLHSAFRWFLIGYLLYLPALILEQPPFENQALPRLFSLLFLLICTLAVYRLTRPNSAFVRDQLTRLNIARITANWWLAARLLTLIGFITVLLNATGYHYAAMSILFSLGSSLVILLLLPPLYRFIYLNTLRLVRRHVAAAEAQSGEESQTESEAYNPPAKAIAPGILKFSFLLLGVILLLRAWGVDSQAIQMLDDIQLYKVLVSGSEPAFVTLGSIVRSLLGFALIIWLIKMLPNFMQVWINPHWNADVGIKYAVTTISRYSLFLLGVVYVVSELHMDLTQLGWLMAAMGVGLGFGLQEIVSNFVSGLILLAERPVKPGDTVTIGTLSGTVSKINIRATTIINFDRQEVMVPNRNLITNEVINWTRSDTINRVVVTIGVAYGSDVDKVSDLLLQIAQEQPKVLKQPEPNVIFMLHGESSLDLDLRVYVAAPEDIMPVRDKLNRQISKLFAEHDIEIPFPQRDLHIRSGSLIQTVQQTTDDNNTTDKK